MGRSVLWGIVMIKTILRITFTAFHNERISYQICDTHREGE